MESLKKSQTKCQMTLTYFIAKKIIVIHLLLFTIILLCCFVTNDKISFRYDVVAKASLLTNNYYLQNYKSSCLLLVDQKI